MTDSTETGPQLLQRLDMAAEKWCAEMVARGIVQADPAPGSDFHGWMCNAIMNAYDIGFGKGQARAAARQITTEDVRRAMKPFIEGMIHKRGTVSAKEWEDAMDLIFGPITSAGGSKP